MTTKRHDGKDATEFSKWLRYQKEIDSSLGYITTNIDFIWKNWKTDEWMLIEEKRHGSQIKTWQQEIFLKIDRLAKADPSYLGFHKIVFSNTNPEDGDIFLDDKKISTKELIKFLRMGTEYKQANIMEI